MTKHTTPWGSIGYITFKRTYARTYNKIQEEFEDTVERELDGIINQLGLELTETQKEFYRYMRLNLKGSVAGRFMWQLGTPTVDRLGLASLQNCFFTKIDDPVKPFIWAFDMLMLGGGVGFSIESKYIKKIPMVYDTDITIERKDTKDADFIIPDSREGWIKLIEKTLKAYFHKGKGFSYSTILVRGAGEPIKGFGGVASGVEPLVKGLNDIISVLDARKGQKLRPIDALDIMNIIGGIVVSGNVRRSALICIGDYDDIDYLKAKRWDLGNIPNWRSNSNNSVVVADTKKLPKEFWETYNQGEPYGLINIRLSRLIGRLGETQYPDPTVDGFNPCAEQSLAHRESCCLAEIYLPNITSQKEFNDVAEMLYLVNKRSLMLPCHDKETEDIVHKNMRMGIGITGVLMATDEQKSWLSPAYDRLRALDKKISKEWGVNKSVKLTTIKPSGTLSLLAGVTPGIHPNPVGNYYIRRIRMASNSKLVKVCKSHGYFTEYKREFDGSEDKGTVVVEFPCSVPESVKTSDDLDCIEHLELVKEMQKKWSDNSVSVSVYYNKEDIDRIKQYLDENFKHNFKSLSFMLKFGHGFDQAPYETISKERYLELSSKVIPITKAEVLEDDVYEGMEACESGACPIK